MALGRSAQVVRRGTVCRGSAAPTYLERAGNPRHYAGWKPSRCLNLVVVGSLAVAASFAAMASPATHWASFAAGRDSSSEFASRPAGDGTRRRREPTEQEAQRLVKDILEVVRGAGPQAGAVRTFQAARAAAVTTAQILRQGEAPALLEAMSSFMAGSWQGKSQDELVARILRRLFENLGATYIKLGQFIASSPTLFPEAYVREFQKCLDKTEAVPFAVIERIVEGELGRPIKEVFRSFNQVPLASASVAQVHVAVLQSTGEEVVVKVLKPDVRDVLQADLGFLYIATRILGFLSPALAPSSLLEIVEEIRSSMLGELDFRRELKNLEVFRAFLVENGLTNVAAAPKPYPEVSTEKILVMERFNGVPLIDLDGIRSYSANPELTLISALNVWALSVRRCELFHADVHAGNLLVLRDGRVGFIDFGIVGRVPEKIWNAVEGLGRAFLVSDATGIARSLIAMGATDEDVDEVRFTADVSKVLAKLSNLEPEVVLRRNRAGGGVKAQIELDEVQVTELLLDIVRAADQNGLKLPREFALLVKQALYFDRYNRLLAPGLDPLRDSRVDLGLTNTKYAAGGIVIDV